MADNDDKRQDSQNATPASATVTDTTIAATQLVDQPLFGESYKQLANDIKNDDDMLGVIDNLLADTTGKVSAAAKITLENLKQQLETRESEEKIAQGEKNEEKREKQDKKEDAEIAKIAEELIALSETASGGSGNADTQVARGPERTAAAGVMLVKAVEGLIANIENNTKIANDKNAERTQDSPSASADVTPGSSAAPESPEQQPGGPENNTKGTNMVIGTIAAILSQSPIERIAERQEHEQKTREIAAAPERTPYDKEQAAFNATKYNTSKTDRAVEEQTKTAEATQAASVINPNAHKEGGNPFMDQLLEKAGITSLIDTARGMVSGGLNLPNLSPSDLGQKQYINNNGEAYAQTAPQPQESMQRSPTTAA